MLIVAAVVNMSVGDNANDALRLTIAVVATAGIVIAVVISKRRSSVISDEAPEKAQVSG